MPFYEYQCKNCGHELEAMQKVSDAPLRKCPHCGKSQLERLMSAPVFRLKGGGWYETDFKDDKDKKRNLADRPGKSEGDSEAPAKTTDDSKVTAKADSVTSDSGQSKRAEVTKPLGKPSQKKAAAKRR